MRRRWKSLGLLMTAAVIAAPAPAQQEHEQVSETTRLYPKNANPDGTLNCYPGCGNPVTLCC